MEHIRINMEDHDGAKSSWSTITTTKLLAEFQCRIRDAGFDFVGIIVQPMTREGQMEFSPLDYPAIFLFRPGIEFAAAFMLAMMEGDIAVHGGNDR